MAANKDSQFILGSPVTPRNQTSRTVVKFNFQNPTQPKSAIYEPTQLYEPKRRIISEMLPTEYQSQFPQPQVQPQGQPRAHTPKFAKDVLYDSNKTAVDGLWALEEPPNRNYNIRVENRDVPNRASWLTSL